VKCDLDARAIRTLSAIIADNKGRIEGRGMNISAESVRFDDDQMWVALDDGRTWGVPLAWFPRLLAASPAAREQVEISRGGLHWPALDEDISVAGLLAGRDDRNAGGAVAA
jgi:Protein of unknown function (DUF2442)